MILDSPLPPAGPFGASLVIPLAALAFFWMPPAGGAAAAAALVPLGTRRPRPRMLPFFAAVRRVVRISSRDLSSLVDIVIGVVAICS